VVLFTQGHFARATEVLRQAVAVPPADDAHPIAKMSIPDLEFK
jgi:hypothetical protein